MLNPIFNLPSFLVGMYFGLVNFTIQRGINDFNEDDKNNYELLEKEQISQLNEKKENKDDELSNKIDMRINSFSDDNKVYRALTFSKPNNIFKKDIIYYNDKMKKSFDEEYEKSKKNLDINMQMETDDIKTEMPFLKSTVNFTNFHRKNQDKKILKIILAIFIIFILSFIFVRYIFIYTNIEKEIKKLDEKSII